VAIETLEPVNLVEVSASDLELMQSQDGLSEDFSITDEHSV